MTPFTPEVIEKITEAVKAVETKTSGEIRVRIRPEFREDCPTIREQAIYDFYMLGLTETKEQTGVLILIVTGAKKFYILGGVGITNILPSEFWEEKAGSMSRHFQAGDFAKGVCEVVEEVGTILAKHFPREADDVNELPDHPVTGGEDEE